MNLRVILIPGTHPNWQDLDVIVRLSQSLFPSLFCLVSFYTKSPRRFDCETTNCKTIIAPVLSTRIVPLEYTL